MKRQIKLFLILLVIGRTIAQEQRAEILLNEVSESMAQFDNIIF